MEYSKKDWKTTLLLTIFLGWTGAHRFYVGKVGTGSVFVFHLIEKIIYYSYWLYLINAIAPDYNPMILTILTNVNAISFFVILIWWIIDIILVACGKFKDSKNKLISHNKPQDLEKQKENMADPLSSIKTKVDSTTQKINDWHKLYTDGIITKEEFENKKKQLMEKE